MELPKPPAKLVTECSTKKAQRPKEKGAALRVGGRIKGRLAVGCGLGCGAVFGGVREEGDEVTACQWGLGGGGAVLFCLILRYVRFVLAR